MITRTIAGRRLDQPFLDAYLPARCGGFIQQFFEMKCQIIHGAVHGDQWIVESKIADGTCGRRSRSIHWSRACDRSGDGQSAAIVAGALSSDPARAKASAPDYDIPSDRAYGSFKEMIESEKALPADKRMDFVTVATPNNTHFDVAKSAAEAGFNVMCDKPMTFDFAQAEELVKVVEKTGVVFALTHNYTGHPLVRQARDMILSGELGEINAIRAYYIQGWLRTRLESSDQKQAKWRTDPKQSGVAGCFGDIGSHAYNLARYMTGLLPESLSCHLRTFESGRALDDYGHAIIKFENGCLATVTASQVSHGRENDVGSKLMVRRLLLAGDKRTRTK